MNGRMLLDMSCVVVVFLKVGFKTINHKNFMK